MILILMRQVQVDEGVRGGGGFFRWEESNKGWGLENVHDDDDSVWGQLKPTATLLLFRFLVFTEHREKTSSPIHWWWIACPKRLFSIVF